MDIDMNAVSGDPSLPEAAAELISKARAHWFEDEPQTEGAADADPAQ